MKVLLFGKRSDRIKPLVKAMGFSIVEKNPEAVITYGGDGTLLSAESLFPSVPKLPIRDNSICIKCQKHQDEVVLKKLQEGKLQLMQTNKLEAHLKGKNLLATNDFTTRNSLQMHSIRYKVFKNNKQIDNLIIGDGVVLATSFGSSGYFKSITKKSFSKGFGLAFNNTTAVLEPLYFDNKDAIKVVIVRGPATLTYDNNSDIYELVGKSEIIFKPSREKLLIYDSSLNCQNCKLKRTH